MVDWQFMAAILDAILDFSARTKHLQFMLAVPDTKDIAEHFGICYRVFSFEFHVFLICICLIKKQSFNCLLFIIHNQYTISLFIMYVHWGVNYSRLC